MTNIIRMQCDCYIEVHVYVSDIIYAFKMVVYNCVYKRNVA